MTTPITFVSQSMLGQFLRCPQQFKRRWIDGEIIPPGVSARRGSAVHEAARVNHEQKIRTEEDLPVEDLQDAARDEYTRLVKEEGIFIPRSQLSEKSKIMNAGLTAAVTLTKLYREQVAPDIWPKLVEKRITADVGLAVPVAGTIDLLTVENWAPDFKTADKSKNQSEADNSLQLSLYAGLIHHATGHYPEMLSLEVLVNTKEPKHQRLTTERGPEDFADVLDRMAMMLRQIQTGLFPPCDPAAWICSETWCGYALTCKYFRRK